VRPDGVRRSPARSAARTGGPVARTRIRAIASKRSIAPNGLGRLAINRGAIGRGAPNLRDRASRGTLSPLANNTDRGDRSRPARESPGHRARAARENHGVPSRQVRENRGLPRRQARGNRGVQSRRLNGDRGVRSRRARENRGARNHLATESRGAPGLPAAANPGVASQRVRGSRGAPSRPGHANRGVTVRTIASTVMTKRNSASGPG